MIKFNNVSKIYNRKKSNEFTALKGVSLTIKDGEMVGVIGKSGAGKSTLLHILGCLDDFEEGEYYLDNQNVSEISESKKAELRNEKIGIVMQDFALIEEYSVEENVMVPLRFSKGCKNKENLVKKALELVGIAELSKKQINKLSGGQKQRVAIARAIVNNPQIILADEPTGALDSKTSKEIVEVFKEINKQGKTVIIITHDLEVAGQCSRIVEISDGEISDGEIKK